MSSSRYKMTMMMVVVAAAMMMITAMAAPTVVAVYGQFGVPQPQQGQETTNSSTSSSDGGDYLTQQINRTLTLGGGNASLIIISDAEKWSAAVMDSDLTQRTVDGSGSDTIDFLCEVHIGGIGTYSHVVQNMGDSGYLKIYVVQKGEILRQAETTAAYGIVSVTGHCK